MNENVREDVTVIEADLRETRHHLHQNPELSTQEQKTAAFVAERLRSLGLEVKTGIGGHGVVADLHGAKPGRRFALRADMDALPIQEQNDLPYRSQNPGVMHACGHDGHTTTLLGAAHILANRRDTMTGSVRFIFQPAEETVNGAKRMCDAGVMEGIDAIVALHGWPKEVGLGQIGVRTGGAMASADTFELVIHGRQAHAAYPHLSVDPIIVGAQIVMAFQTIAGREVNPNDPVVVTVGQFHSGTAHNIISDTARLVGTVRTLSPQVRAAMPERIRRIAEGICAATRATCELTYAEGTPPVVNDAEMIDLIRVVGSEAFGTENIVTLPYPTMGSEDFAFYLEHAPGAMFFLGLGETPAVHTPTFNFDDRALPTGVEMFSRIALKFLGQAR